MQYSRVAPNRLSRKVVQLSEPLGGGEYQAADHTQRGGLGGGGDAGIDRA
jgi:hypothetical protein